MPDLVPTLRRVLRPLRPVLRPIWRRLRGAPTARDVARRPTDMGPRPTKAIPDDQRWLYFHEEPEDRRISVLEGRHPGSRVLIVATGPSAKQVVPFDARLKERYDVVVALNGSIAHVTSADYFLAVESHAHLWDWYHHPVGPHTTRCVSESGLRYAREAGQPDTQPALLLLRHLYETPVDIRHYRNAAGEEGLLNGSRGETRLGRGTVTAQALHFAGMLGASVIHVIGADLHFHGPVQHFYGQNEYGTHEVDGKRYHRLDTERKLNPIVEAVHPETGEIVETTLHFRESAEFIDEVIRDVFPPAGIRIADFSHGLISAAPRGDFATFMATGEDPADALASVAGSRP